MTEFAREFIPARAAHDLVDRDKELDVIHHAIFESGNETRVLLITAGPGMGKTFLLRKVLQRCREGGLWHDPKRILVPPEAGRDLVDFFHSRTHSVEGFTREVWEALGGGKAAMKDFQEALERFERESFHLAEIHRELSGARERLGRTFLDEFNRLTRDKRLVLALDTAEKLLYEAGRIEQELQLQPEESNILSWLTGTFLREAQNTVVLLAGRPESDVLRLKTTLQNNFGDRFVHVDFGNLDEQSALRYFGAVAQAVRKEGDIRTAERIEAIPEETRRVMWLYTEGRPILLSLLIDHLVMAGSLLPEVTDSLNEAKGRLRKEGKKRVLKSIEKGLVADIQDRTTREADIVRSLAWARKGLSAEMLASLHGMPVDETQRLLDGISELSFIKRLGDRYFLHDALYEMFEEHVLQRVPEARREREYGIILAYYEKAIREAREKLKEAMGKPLEERAAEVGQAHLALARLLVEEMHYSWRLKPVSGFQRWEEYHREMYWANDIGTQMELDDEAREFLRKWPQNADLNGLARLEVELTLLLHRLERMILRGQYDEVAKIYQEARPRCEGLSEVPCTLVGARMDILLGEALARRSQRLSDAENLLNGAVNALARLKGPEGSDFYAKSRDVFLAQAWNNLGYLYRTMGRYGESVDAYRASARLWRRLVDEEQEATLRFPLEAQYANTLNNMAWALAWTGQFQQALRICQDALEMRRKLGPAGPVAFSLNTFGLIQAKADQPHRAERACREALDIFIRLEQPRGIGMALTALSEMCRRKAELEALYSADEQRRLLEEAIVLAERAEAIFREQIKEDAQRAQALIELGCAHRDLIRVLKGADEERNKHVNLGEDALNKAMDAAAEPNLVHMRVDAQVNLAWLYHYAGRDDIAQQTADEARRKIFETLGARERQILRKRKLQQSFLLVQLGKIELLQGEIALQGGEFKSAGEHFTLSLAYDEKYAEDFRDMRRGMDRMYALLKGLNAGELGQVLEGIEQAAKTCSLSRPTRMHRFLQDSFGVSQ